ncbi:MAG: YraN family protein [Candidatus Obscuribacterales bacterium]|nr:YraN family protein [Candidatus Obscuribacterales bacterium]
MSFKRISQKTDLNYTEPPLTGVLMLQEEKPECLSAEKNKKVSNHRIRLGRTGEKAAADCLTAKGWKILASNWRHGKMGEIDIIAEDETKTIVFIEVKTRNRTTIEYGFRNAGFESVHHLKQRKIIACAFAYLNTLSGKRRNLRFDVIVVEFLDGRPVIHHVLQAF